jgi:hypothetical protein
MQIEERFASSGRGWNYMAWESGTNV